MVLSGKDLMNRLSGTRLQVFKAYTGLAQLCWMTDFQAEDLVKARDELSNTLNALMGLTVDSEGRLEHQSGADVRR